MEIVKLFRDIQSEKRYEERQRTSLERALERISVTRSH